MARWTILDSEWLTGNIEEEVRIIEKKKDVLQALLSDGRISQTTYDLLDKNASRLVSAYMSLKQNIDGEKSFWALSNSEEVRTLEQILMDFKVQHVLGDMNDEEWKKKSEVIISGLNAMIPCGLYLRLFVQKYCALVEKGTNIIYGV